MSEPAGGPGRPRSWPSGLRAGFGMTAGVLLIASLVIGSCSWLVSQQPVDPVVAFQSRPELGLERGEVLDRLGEPLRIDGDTWTYTRSRAWSDLELRVRFGADGRVTRVD